MATDGRNDDRPNVIDIEIMRDNILADVRSPRRILAYPYTYCFLRSFSCETCLGRYVIRRTDLVFRELMRAHRHYSPTTGCCMRGSAMYVAKITIPGTRY